MCSFLSRTTALFALLAIMAGCATVPKPATDASAPEDSSGTLVADVLRDLAAQDEAISGFRASGKFMLKSPELLDVQVLRQSTIRFRRPADLHVVGRKYSKAVFRLTCSGEGFLIELPTERQYFHSKGGARFASVSRSVSPRDIANEMFFPEDWSSINGNQVLLSDLAENGASAVLNIYTSRRRDTLKRKVRVEGPPWRIVENLRYDGGDEPIAVTTLGGYREREGAWYATAYESRFPGENAFMQFEASTFEINAPLEAGDFDLEAQLNEVRQKGFVSVERQTR